MRLTIVGCSVVVSSELVSGTEVSMLPISAGSVTMGEALLSWCSLS